MKKQKSMLLLRDQRKSKIASTEVLLNTPGDKQNVSGHHRVFDSAFLMASHSQESPGSKKGNNRDWLLDFNC